MSAEPKSYSWDIITCLFSFLNSECLYIQEFVCIKYIFTCTSRMFSSGLLSHWWLWVSKSFYCWWSMFLFSLLFFSEWAHLFALQNLILLQNPKIIFPFKRYTSFLIALEMFSSHVLVCSSSWFTICLQCKAKAEVQFFFIDIELLGVDLCSPNRKQVWNAARWQNACLAWVRPWHSIPSTDKVGSEK